MTNKKPWAGRFTEETDNFVEAFTASVSFDQRLAPYDIQGSIAHAEMLARQGIISPMERNNIHAGLGRILGHINAGSFKWSEKLEDVHMNLEVALIENVGDAGKKLHTARSRNDQVATDIRLWLRDELEKIIKKTKLLANEIIDLAEKETDTILPGFTHLQIAQPVTFGHHLMAWFEMLERDYCRLDECSKRMNQMPLGAAALAGTSFKIDRNYTAELLGFLNPCRNSIDAVSDRDFAIEFSADASILMMHLTRMSEELIIWSSSQFKFVSLSDSFCTGSSIMPQKKNPDVPELIRGKSGRIFGHLFSLLTLMKSQPLAYNRDNQEDKEPLFDTVDTLNEVLEVFTNLIPNIQCHSDNMRSAALSGFSTATDLADYLVQKGVPFRDAHEAVGKAVAFCIDKNIDLSDIELNDLKKFNKEIEEDVFSHLTLEASVKSRNHEGGTAPEQVRYAIKNARERINK
mgnify:CR=1 FL=1|tara:strand:+ start:25768 stop:27150 length:1383 start_codon:yes stop_codon:yes gene_type:complete